MTNPAGSTGSGASGGSGQGRIDNQGVYHLSPGEEHYSYPNPNSNSNIPYTSTYGNQTSGLPGGLGAKIGGTIAVLFLVGMIILFIYLPYWTKHTSNTTTNSSITLLTAESSNAKFSKPYLSTMKLIGTIEVPLPTTKKGHVIIKTGLMLQPYKKYKIVLVDSTINTHGSLCIPTASISMFERIRRWSNRMSSSRGRFVPEPDDLAYRIGDNNEWTIFFYTKEWTEPELISYELDELQISTEYSHLETRGSGNWIFQLYELPE